MKLNMEENKQKKKKWAGILAQTSLWEVDATTGGPSEFTYCVASGQNSAVKLAVHCGCSAIAKLASQRRSDTVHEDSDLESVATLFEGCQGVC